MALWGGRFETGPDVAMENLSRSVQFDYRLAPYDIRINIAHVNQLVANGVVSQGNGEVIKAGLKSLLMEVRDGKLAPIPSDEDIHSCIERTLIERVGQVGGSIRAGRSRNDLVATAFKLYFTEHLIELSGAVLQLVEAINSQCAKMDGVVAPGFTHLQHAQPILFSHELAKHSHALIRDVDRINSWLSKNSVSPFGSGALSGSALVPHPEKIAAEIGFESIVLNSIDGVSDRDWVLEGLFICSLVGVHLSKMGEEYILWNSTEFGWVRLDDKFSTGSSIMPQKKNPDVAELARGKSGRLIGNLMSMFITAKGLAFAYNRDLQEDKEVVFDSIETLLLLLPAFSGMVLTSQFDAKKISSGAIAGFSLATEIADYLAIKGVPFNQAHEISGACVKVAEGMGCGLEDLTIDQLKQVDERIDSDLLSRLTAQGALASRTSSMSSGPTAVAKQLQVIAQQTKDAISDFQRNQSSFRSHIYEV
jgi:argininosuccinate lyase